MALVLNDRVRETSTTTGTGDITLGGAVQGFITFASGVGTSNTTYYCITEDDSTNFEVGLGTLSASTTLQRTTVISNSAGNTNKINFSGGTLDVFVTGPASKSVLEDASNNVTLSDDLTVSGDLKSAALKATDGGNIINQSGTDITIGASGDTVTLAAGASQSGFGNISWVTSVKTTDFNATAGEGYFVDSSSNSVSVTLPTGVAGESVQIVDYVASANTNEIIFIPQSGEKIEGGTDGQGVTANRQATTLTYSGATQGWVVSSAGDSGPIAPPTITFNTASGTLGTLTDTQRSDPAGNLSSAGATASFGTLSFSIQSGSLPSGVTLNSTTAAFEGTANAVASETTSNFTVRATITETGTTSDRAFSITVQAPTITFSTASGTLGTLSGASDRADPNGQLSPVTATTSSGTLTYAIQSGSLPAGLTLNSSTGAFVGTADAVGSTTTSNFTVRATNTSGTTSDRAFSITVDPDPAFIAASGGTISTSGDFKIHAFTGPGTFSVSDAGNAFGANTVEYLVVAGGGSGGGDRGGGGGAGGFRDNFPSPVTGGHPVSVTSYPISIGGGGPASRETGGSTGSSSSAFGFTSAGGGGGAHLDGSASSGGSGGGGSNSRPGGSGNSPPVSPSQGRPGGTNPAPIPANAAGGGGGGGFAASGGNGGPSSGGNGGNGGQVPQVPTSYGSPAQYFGGGGGGGRDGRSGGSGGSGGLGGGTAGISAGLGHGTRSGNGAANTGGGSGGAGVDPSPSGGSGNGGSGIVLIRYKFQ